MNNVGASLANVSALLLIDDISLYLEFLVPLIHILLFDEFFIYV